MSGNNISKYPQIPKQFIDAFAKLILLSQKSNRYGDLPISACLCDDTGKIVSIARNQIEELSDATKHAEIVAIANCCQILKTSHLSELTLLCTLEPCIMCAGAILNGKIKRVIFGAYDLKFGAGFSVWDLLRDPLSPHHPEVYGGYKEKECSKMLEDFFKDIRFKKTKLD